MRISDWSSDVCSSDLDPGRAHVVVGHDGLRASAGAGAVDPDPLAEGSGRLVAEGGVLPKRCFQQQAVAVAVLRDVPHPLLEPSAGAPRRHVGAVERDGAGGEVLEPRSEEHTSELQSLMRISYAVFCLKKKKIKL